MIKITFILFTFFSLSCAPTVNKASSSKTKIDRTKFVISDTLPLPAKAVKAKKDSAQLAIKINESPILNANDKTNTRVDHSVWNKLLATYVNIKGEVNYKGILSKVETLDNYLLYLAKNNPKTNWSKNEKLAYYINLYNAATVKLILNNYPTRSIKDLKNPWSKAWVKIGAKTFSLGDIEHKVLRQMNEPRVHFAINCASYSCPKLLNEAFTSSQIESQLQKLTVDFINNSDKNLIAKHKIELSNIFKWYKKDFTKNGSLIDYINLFATIKISENASLKYLKYDWSLNEAK